MAQILDDPANLVGKLVSLIPNEDSFVNDNGQTVKYKFFEAVAIVDSEEYQIIFKVKNFDDKLMILKSAEDVE